MKIIYRLLLLTMLPVCLIWGLGFYASRIGQQSLYQSISETTVARARAIIDELDHVMHHRISYWRTFSQSEEVQNAVSNSKIEGDFISDSRKKLAAINLKKILRQKIRQLNQQNGFQLYVDILITDKTGELIAGSRYSSKKENSHQESWWQKAKEEGVHIVDFGFDPKSNMFATSICLRIEDQTGGFAGVLKVALNIEEAAQLIDRRSYNPGTKKRQRVSLFTSKRELIHTGYGDWADMPPVTDSVPEFSPNSFAIEHKRDHESHKEVLAVFTKSKGFGEFSGLGWILCVESYSDEALKPMFQLGNRIVFLAFLATVFAIIFGGLFVYSFSNRIHRLTRATKELAQGNLTTSAPVHGNDELALLGKSFNHMSEELLEANGQLQHQATALESKNETLLKEISERKRIQAEREDLNRQLVESSRLAGMAEIATGMLHNVGNVLNSVNVSATLIREKMRSSKVDSLQRANQVLHAHRDDLPNFLASDQRGKIFPDLLSQLTEAIADEQSETNLELSTLLENVRHIKEIVKMQQNFAHAGGVHEPIKIDKLIEDAIKINEAAFTKHGIQIDKNFDDMPILMLDKHKLLQILVNLVSNATQALASADIKERLLQVTAEKDERYLTVRIKDNGVGIPEENLTRIFNHGFTTKRDGHGFGLHSCALAAQDLGGALSVESDGHGHGATFSLKLPLQMEKDED